MRLLALLAMAVLLSGCIIVPAEALPTAEAEPTAEPVPSSRYSPEAVVGIVTRHFPPDPDVRKYIPPMRATLVRDRVWEITMGAPASPLATWEYYEDTDELLPTDKSAREMDTLLQRYYERQ